MSAPAVPHPAVRIARSASISPRDWAFLGRTTARAHFPCAGRHARSPGEGGDEYVLGGTSESITAARIRSWSVEGSFGPACY
jgi:hypothetical protein